jgi:putative transposase
MPSVAAYPNERWATDLCRVWSGRDGWATLALVMGVSFYNNRRPHQALGMKTPAEAFALAA